MFDNKLNVDGCYYQFGLVEHDAQFALACEKPELNLQNVECMGDFKKKNWPRTYRLSSDVNTEESQVENSNHRCT